MCRLAMDVRCDLYIFPMRKPRWCRRSGEAGCCQENVLLERVDFHRNHHPPNQDTPKSKEELIFPLCLSKPWSERASLRTPNQHTDWKLPPPQAQLLLNMTNTASELTHGHSHQQHRRVACSHHHSPS